MNPEQKEFLDNQRESLKTKMKELRKEFEDKSKKFFAEATFSLFKQYPQLESFAWSQSQEYNDEGYSFYARTDAESLTINGNSEPQGIRDSCTIGQDIKKHAKISMPTEANNLITEGLKLELENALKVEEAHYELANAVSNVLGAFKEEDYEMMFGDGFTIEVNRNGDVNISCSDYR